jgi:predicted double-glycine peptidase
VLLLFGLAIFLNVNTTSAASSVSLTDHTTPKVTSVTPANNSIVTSTKNIKVRFSEKIKFGNKNIVLKTISGKTISSQKSISYNILTVTPTSTVGSGVKYSLTLNSGSVTDLAGNRVSNYSTRFTVSPINLAQMKDGLSRVQKFYKQNNRLPKYVSYGTNQINISVFQKIIATQGLKIVTTKYPDGWVSLKNIVYDHQDTSYTCGPSSLKMAISNFGMNLNEMGLASYASSNSNIGTSHTGLITAVKKVNLKYGTHFNLSDVTFSSKGWAGLRSYLVHNDPVILHIESFLNPNTSGHYVVLVGININSGLVKIADPSYGYRTLTFNQLLTRMNWIVNTGRSTEVVLPLLN